MAMDAYRGQLAALLGAFLWATATAIYERVSLRVPPTTLNAAKGAIAIALLLATLLVYPAQSPDLTKPRIVLLALSGVLGIGIGDTAYFFCLSALGSRKSLLLESLAPILAASLATVALDERLSLLAWSGILVTVAGVAWTIAEQSPSEDNIPLRLDPARLNRGVMFGLLAALMQASGGILARSVLGDRAIAPLHSALIRLVAGSALALVLAVAGGEGRQLGTTLRQWRSDGRQDCWSTAAAIGLAALLGSYWGIWLQQTAFKYANAGVVQTLLSTTPIFILPFVALRGDRVSIRAILGASMAVVGIALLALGNPP